VTDSKHKGKSRNDRPLARLAYAPPTLKEFGPVAALTQGGNGSVSEAAGMMMGTMDMKKRP
jgi:hypothetical protein